MNKFGKKVLGKLGVAAGLLAVLAIVSCGKDDGVKADAEASFEVSVSGLTATFTNTSSNATDYMWDFGDGTTSTDESPVKTYACGDVYSVTLTADEDSEATADITAVGSVVAETGDDSGAAGSIDLAVWTAPANPYFDGFDGVDLTVVTNPDPTCGNDSESVVKWDFGVDGCQEWAGAGWKIGYAPGSPPTQDATYGSGTLDFDNQPTTFTMDVWAPVGTEVKLRLEADGFPNVDPVQEVTATTTVDNGWETLTFAFQAQDAGNSTEFNTTPDGETDTYQSIIMYINQGADCSATATYYFDNLKQGS